MAVKIDEINSLEEVASKLSTFSNEIREATQDATVKLEAKVEGEKAEAIEQYISMMNDLSSKIYDQFPNAVLEFSSAMRTYHGTITGQGFSSKARSSKPEVEETYCEKLKGQQIQQIQDSAKGIKDAIVAVEEDASISAEISIPGCSSSIDTAITTFETDLTSKIDEIKAVRSALQQGNTQVISSLQSVTEQLNSCLAAIDQASVLGDPESGLNPDTVLTLIAKGYMTKENMQEGLSGIKTKEDAQAINYLAAGKYEQYFEMNSKNISNETYTLAAAMFQDLIDIPTDNADDLAKVVNAMLKADEKYKGGNVTKLTAVLEGMMLQTVNEMTELDPNSPQYKLLDQAFNKMLAIDNLFTTLHKMKLPKQTTPDTTGNYHNYYQLSNLSINVQGQIGFDLSYESSWDTRKGFGDKGEVGHQKVKDLGKATITNHGVAGGTLSEYVEAMDKFDKEKQDLVLNYLKDTASTAIGIYNPFMGTVLEKMSETDYQVQIKDYLKDSNNKTVKNSSKMAYSFLDTLNSWKELDKKKAEVANKFYNAIVGVGPTDMTYPNNVDYPNLPGQSQDNHNGTIAGQITPEAARRLKELNENGLTNFGYLDETQIKEYQNILENEDYKKEASYLVPKYDENGQVEDAKHRPKLSELDPERLKEALNLLNEIEKGQAGKNMDDCLAAIQKYSS